MVVFKGKAIEQAVHYCSLAAYVEGSGAKQAMLSTAGALLQRIHMLCPFFLF